MFTCCNKFCLDLFDSSIFSSGICSTRLRRGHTARSKSLRLPCFSVLLVWEANVFTVFKIYLILPITAVWTTLLYITLSAHRKDLWWFWITFLITAHHIFWFELNQIQQLWILPMWTTPLCLLWFLQGANNIRLLRIIIRTKHRWLLGLLFNSLDSRSWWCCDSFLSPHCQSMP